MSEPKSILKKKEFKQNILNNSDGSDDEGQNIKFKLANKKVT